MQQVCVFRNSILESANNVMEAYARRHSLLELQYVDECGVGLAASREFYVQLSHELQKKGLGMWRGDDDNPTATAGMCRNSQWQGFWCKF
jgi:E3 ubiquitin-protein ligase TRIP12